MRTKTRFISLLLALVMSFSLITTAFAADIPEDAITITDDDGNVIYLTDSEGNVIYWYNPETGETVWYNTDDNADNTQPTDNADNTFVDEDLALVTSFSDVKRTAWYYNDVTECAKLGIVAGFENGTFRPDEKVSSVQLITMLTRTFYNDKVEAAQKTKPAGTPWYWANKKVAEDVGMSNKLKAVDDNAMNRYEMAVALRNVAVNHGKSITSDQSNAAINAIKEYTSIPSNYRTPVKTCYALGIITGMADGTFSGTQSMTRAQACTVIMRMLKLINSYNPGDKDNDQYDDGKNQNTENNNQNQNTGKLANGQDATVENVQAILDQIKREYPTGTVWSDPKFIDGAHNNFYAAGTHAGDSTNDVGAGVGKYGRASLKYACGGWAAMLSDRIFGRTGAPCREVTDPTKVRPGDILVTMSSNGTIYHVGIILQYVPAGVWANGGMTPNNDRFVTCDGNDGARAGQVGKVYWGMESFLGNGFGDIGTGYHILTRYPEGESESEIP